MRLSTSRIERHGQPRGLRGSPPLSYWGQREVEALQSPSCSRREDQPNHEALHLSTYSAGHSHPGVILSSPSDSNTDPREVNVFTAAPSANGPSNRADMVIKGRSPPPPPRVCAVPGQRKVMYDGFIERHQSPPHRRLRPGTHWVRASCVASGQFRRHSPLHSAARHYIQCRNEHRRRRQWDGPERRHATRDTCGGGLRSADASPCGEEVT